MGGGPVGAGSSPWSPARRGRVWYSPEGGRWSLHNDMYMCIIDGRPTRAAENNHQSSRHLPVLRSPATLQEESDDAVLSVTDAAQDFSD